jgi:hypothetical protein
MEMLHFIMKREQYRRHGDLLRVLRDDLGGIWTEDYVYAALRALKDVVPGGPEPAVGTGDVQERRQAWRAWLEVHFERLDWDEETSSWQVR